MTRLAIIGAAGWGIGLNYALASDIFGLPFAIEVLWAGTGLMALGILSVMYQATRNGAKEEQ